MPGSGLTEVITELAGICCYNITITWSRYRLRILEDSTRAIGDAYIPSAFSAKLSYT